MIRGLGGQPVATLSRNPASAGSPSPLYSRSWPPVPNRRRSSAPEREATRAEAALSAVRDENRDWDTTIGDGLG